MQLRYMVHAQPAWRERGDVRLPVKIPRYADEREQWVEELWCRRLEGGRFELCCIPFWLPDLALGSIVEPDHAAIATRLALIAPSGRATLWAMFADAAEPGTGNDLAATLSQLQCLVEWSEPLNLLAISAETEPAARAAFDLLIAGQRQGNLRFGKTTVPHIATHRPLAAAHQGRAFVHAPLDGRWLPFRWERLAAEPVAPDHFRLTDAPFFAAGLAYGDEVETAAEPEDMAENPVLRVVARSRRLAVRLRLTGDRVGGVLLARADRLGCGVEWYAAHLAVLDVPPEAKAKVRALLSVAQAAGELTYEAPDRARWAGAERRAAAASLRPSRPSGTTRRALRPRPRE